MQNPECRPMEEAQTDICRGEREAAALNAIFFKESANVF